MAVSTPLATINLVVRNGEKYIRHCLDSVKAQTYKNIEINILDNGSTDQTLEIAREYASHDSRFIIHDSGLNLGMWPGQEELLNHSHGKYIVALSVDVILDPDFIKNAAARLEQDDSIGALQPKVYQYRISEIGDQMLDIRDQGSGAGLPTSDFRPPTSVVIDTCGFQIFRSRRLVNIGHGEIDRGQFDREQQVFAVEGAVPVFRRQALESCRLETQGGSIVDKDFFWYGDDLDLAWRMRLFGWKQIYAPSVVAYHDRSTTKDVSHRWLDYFDRIKKRHQIPLKKRRLDWANYRLALIKNDHLANIFKDLPRIVIREIMVLGYTLIFEPGVFLELPRFLRLIPKIAKRRREIMKRAKATAQEIRKWMIT